MRHEKAIAAAVEPLAEQLVVLERQLAAVQLVPGPAGEKGAPGAQGEAGAPGKEGHDGRDGSDGAGIDAPLYVPGAVYRTDAVVTAHLGQHYRALRDTVEAPGDGDEWQRLGSAGFRHRGAFKADTTYRDGDLFVEGFGTFVVVNGAPTLLAGRGSVGAPGAPGARGERGAEGKSGTTIIAAEVSGFKLVLVTDTGGDIDHVEADFGPAYRALAKEAFDATLPEVLTELRELRDEVAMLKRELRRVTA